MTRRLVADAEVASMRTIMGCAYTRFDSDDAPMIDTEHITGLILAGGRGSRMGGVDKGLQPHLGMPLAMHALLRLSPQVGEVLINANRNLGAYESMGVPVWPDALPDYPGPLAGFLAGLEQCETPYLATVPCDSPLFPEDLVARLGARLEDDDAEIAIAATREGGELRLQPVFCLMSTTVLESLVRFTSSGRRKIDAWTATLRHVAVEFEDAQAFVNANTLDELRGLQR
jgi:molybdopterin-guanine dinucleotide biosynthesis protein A